MNNNFKREYGDNLSLNYLIIIIIKIKIKL
jgi:hypothetical protein